MNICGVLVHAFPAQLNDVDAAHRLIPGVEVHGRADDGRIIVTFEDTFTTVASDGTASVHALSGVVAAALV